MIYIVCTIICSLLLFLEKNNSLRLFAFVGILLSMSGIFTLISTESTANQIIAFLSIAITIGSAIVILGKKIFWLAKSYQLSQLIGGKEVVVHIPSRNLGRPKPVVAVEDYNTFENIRDVLLSRRINVHLRYIPVNGTVELDSKKPNIVICGPKNSYITKEAFANLSNIDFVHDDDWYFRLTSTNTEFHSPINDTKNQYAFLGKILYGNAENVILICGIHAIGSDGVSHFLSSEKNLHALLSKNKEKAFFCIIKSSFSEEEKKVYNSELIVMETI